MKAMTGARAALAGFRRLPEIEPPLEYYAGRILQKMSPKLIHSILQSELILRLTLYCRPQNLGRVFSELRCVFGGISIVPDLSYYQQDRMPDPTNRVDREDVLFAPDLIVEILSPGQTVKELTRKLRAALRAGVRVGWLIDEVHRKVYVFRRGRSVTVLVPGDSLAGEDVIPGYALPLDELFGWVDAP